jgi:hypothetical protein
VRQGGKCLRISIENIEPLDSQRFDPESGEEITWFFGMLTKKGSQGDNVKVAKILRSIEAAGAHSHTYDAKVNPLLKNTNSCNTRSIQRKKLQIPSNSFKRIPSNEIV